MPSLYLRDRRLSIIIPSARAFPQELLKALTCQTEKGDEVLVIRNANRHAPHHWVGICSGTPLPHHVSKTAVNGREAVSSGTATCSISVIHLDKDYGASAARNRGWVEARNNSVLFLDDDVTVDRKFLDMVRHFLNSKPKVGIVTFRMQTVKTSQWSPVVETTISLDRGDEIRRTKGLPLRLQDVWMYGAGGAMLVSRRLLKATGGFKRSLGAGCRNGGTEDAEFLWHASRHTDIEYCGKIVVGHFGVTTANGLCRKLREYGRAIGNLGGAAPLVEGLQYVYEYCLHIAKGIRLRQDPKYRLRTLIHLKISVARAILETVLAYFSSLLTSREVDVLCAKCRGLR